MIKVGGFSHRFTLGSQVNDSNKGELELAGRPGLTLEQIFVGEKRGNNN